MAWQAPQPLEHFFCSSYRLVTHQRARGGEGNKSSMEVNMESGRDLHLKFDCNKNIDINPKEYWGEIIQLAFLNDKSEYLVITRLAYENEVYFEHNNQINFLYSDAKDITFELEETILKIEVHNPTKGNLPNTFIINTNQEFDNLRDILQMITEPREYKDADQVNN